MATEKTFIKLTTEMVTKSLFCLPLPTLALVSSYFTIEEPLLRSPYVVQTPFFDSSEYVMDNSNDFQYHGSDANSTNKNNSGNKNNSDNLYVDIGNGTKIPLATWRESLLVCLEHLVEPERFTLKIKSRLSHKTDSIGNSPVYDLTFCNSDYFGIPGELFEKALKEMGKRVGEGNHMYSSYCWAFVYLFNKSQNETVFGTFSTTTTNLDKNGDDTDKEDSDNEMITEKSSEIKNQVNLSREEQKKQKIEEIKKILRYKKILKRPCYLHDVIDEADESEKMCPIVSKDTMGCSHNVHFLDENSLVDSNIDRSYLTTAGIINLLIYFDCIINNLEAVTPNRPLLPEDFDEDQTVTQEEKAKIKKMFSSKIPDFPNSNISLRDDLHTIIQDKDNKGYHVYTYTKEISDVIGVWGRDDLYLTYISYIRKMSIVPGFDKVKESLTEDNQGSYGGYMDSESSTSNTSQKENVSRGNQVKDKKRAAELWDKEIKMMKEERDIYCESVHLAVTAMFKSVSEFVKHVDLKYKSILDSNTKPTVSNQKSSFYDKKKFMDYLKSENISYDTKSEFDDAYSAFLSRKQKSNVQKFVYKGSNDYEDLKNFYSGLTKTFISMMDDYGTLPYYEPDPNNPRTFSDFYQVHKLVKPFEFCEIVKELDSSDLSINEMLKNTNLGEYYHYEFMDLQVENYYGKYPVLCLYGIPEAILYDEMATYKWIATLWKMKTDSDSKAFSNKNNKFSGHGLMHMCSQLWQAKSIITMTEYKNLSLRFNKYFFNDVIFKNCVPVDKRRKPRHREKENTGKKAELNSHLSDDFNSNKEEGDGSDNYDDDDTDSEINSDGELDESEDELEIKKDI